MFGTEVVSYDAHFRFHHVIGKCAWCACKFRFYA